MPSKMKSGSLRLAFVAGLSDKKLDQFLRPLQALDVIDRIDLYRRRPFAGDKIRWIPVPKCFVDRPIPGDLWRLAALLGSQGKPDVFIGCFQHYHGLYAHIAGRLLCRPTIQLVITDVDWNMARPLARHATLSAAACGVMGPVSLDKLRARGFLGPAEVITLPHRALTRVVTQEVPRLFDCLAVGNLAVEKDYPWMLKTFAALRNRLPNARLALAGAGLESALAQQVKALGLVEAVTFLGLLDEAGLAEAYGACRLLLMTSNVEGLPMVAVEAMSYGRPVVATTVGDLPWLLRPGLDGMLAAHGDTDGMVLALEAVLAEPGRADTMGQNALERYQALVPLFSTATISQRWSALLEHVIAKH